MTDVRTQAAVELAGEPWAIQAETYTELQAMLQRLGAATVDSLPEAPALAVERLETPAELDFIEGRAIEAQSQPESALPRGLARQTGSVALIPVHGVLVPHAGFLARLFGSVGTDQIAQAITRAASDSGVKAIVLDVNSPGGMTRGMHEIADVVFAARQAKPVVSIANHVAASAAYWLAGQATEMVSAPHGLIGAVGTLMTHRDFSAELERVGITVTHVHAGARKTEGAPEEPLSESARQTMQDIVDDAYGYFTEDVARGRGVDVGVVTGEGYGEGAAFAARDAQTRGLIDRIETTEQLFARLGVGARSGDSEESEAVDIFARGRAQAAIARDEIEISRNRSRLRRLVQKNGWSSIDDLTTAAVYPFSLASQPIASVNHSAAPGGV